MHRRWLALFLSFAFALIVTGPVLAQDSTSTPETGDRSQRSTSTDATPAASPAADDEPLIDLREYGAWGVASREFGQTGQELDYPFLFSTSIAAFDDADTAAEAFPQIREIMIDQPEYETLEEIDATPIGDDQFFLYGQIESSGFTYNLGLLVVLDGKYMTLAGGISYETHDMQDDLISLATDTLGRAVKNAPKTGDDLLAILPTVDDLPGADTIPEPYEVTRENTRLAE